MKIVRHPQNCPDAQKNAVIALGNFDGIHRGHQHILNTTKQLAAQNNCPSAILTFKPHPVSYFAKHVSPFRITPFRNKYLLLEQLGIDICYLLHFNKQLATLSARDFVEQILIRHLKANHLVIGHDFIFGHNRQGNVELLKEYAQKNAFNLTQISPITHNNTLCSSTQIRTLISSGELEQANDMLGHPFILSGRVIKGQQRGRTLNFPTANISTKNYIHPKLGIYIGEVFVPSKNRWLQAAISIGKNPTFTENITTIEAHILNFNEDIYGEHIDIKLLHYIRA